MADSANSSDLSSPESPEEVQQCDEEEEEASADEDVNTSDSDDGDHGDDNRIIEESSSSTSEEEQDDAIKTPNADNPNSPDWSKNSDVSDDSASEILDRKDDKSSPTPIPDDVKSSNSPCQENPISISAPISPRPIISASRPSLDKPRGLDSLEGELDFEAEIHVKEDRDDQNANDENENMKSSPIEANLEIKTDQDAQGENGEQEEGEQDDGEVSGDDDLEEGEVKDSFPDRKARPPPVCRFFNRGQCTWGTNCRFIHPGVNDKGNYNMFATNKAPPLGPGMMPGIPPPPMGPLPMPIGNPRLGILKKASRRKEQEPDFEEKRLNLTIEGPDRGPEYEKDDFYGRSPFRRPNEGYGYYGLEEEPYDNLEREAREYWRGGRYENFEVRWPRQEYDYRVRTEEVRERDRERERSRPAFRPSYERENVSRIDRGRPNEKERWREERHTEVQVNRSRGDEWRDPWRRSKTPKGRRSTSRSRGRSHRSYSSGSSRSYSSGSSKSSYSYSRSSSSRSSYYSSRRSRSHSRARLRSRSHSPLARRPETKSADSKKRATVPVRRPSPPKPRLKTPPAVERRKRTPPVVAPPAARGQPSRRRAETDRYKKTRTPSYSGSESNRSLSHSLSRSSSSRSRSLSRSRSHSPSRSYSRSLSMSSVSSASSSATHTSSRSESDAGAQAKKGGPQKPAKLPKKTESPAVTAEPVKAQEKDVKAGARPSQRDTPRPKEVDKRAEKTMQQLEEDLEMLEHERRNLDSLTRIPLILPMGTPKGSKDPLKQSGHKQQIKLTLLNKAPTDKSTPKDEGSKANKNGERGEEGAKGSSKQSPGLSSGSRKRPASPVAPTSISSKSSAGGGGSGGNIPPVSSLKKSTSSRREELLKQLKAVEDAIARKRAKLN